MPPPPPNVVTISAAMLPLLLDKARSLPRDAAITLRCRYEGDDEYSVDSSTSAYGRGGDVSDDSARVRVADMLC